ncbi:hypothetical protein NQ315_014789 [Exocentrus adspersus]|uniref:CCHC-type domain-containing protein n=1 Tax=Exocentrus adspersus TaxID=1586481 RepID=A0AAV8VN69_9CUCU|nr:hypothetical protein NQ315_014789 [Exocentrus adspersus]
MIKKCLMLSVVILLFTVGLLQISGVGYSHDFVPELMIDSDHGVEMAYSQREFNEFCEQRLLAQQGGEHGENINGNRSGSTAINQTRDGCEGANDGRRDNTRTIEALMQTVTALVQQNTEIMKSLQGNQVPQSTEVASFYIMPDLNKAIDNFTGELGPTVASKWITQLKNIALLHNWPDAFKLQTACTHLTGAAKSWYQGRACEIKNWEDFEIAFRKTFIFEESKTDLWSRMQKRVQKTGENISSYFHDKVTLCKICGLSFNEVKEQVAIGMLSEKLADFVLARPHVDEDELYKDIISYERVHGARRTKEPRGEINRQVQKRNVPRNPKPGAGAEGNPEGSLQPRCYNCNARGHFKSSCTKPVRTRGSCYICGSKRSKICGSVLITSRR